MITKLVFMQKISEGKEIKSSIHVGDDVLCVINVIIIHKAAVSTI